MGATAGSDFMGVSNKHSKATNPLGKWLHFLISTILYAVSPVMTYFMLCIS